MYKTIIVPVVLYECETWSLTLREYHILRVFENRVLKRIFGPMSSWLQIRRPGFDSRHYQKKKLVGLEQGPLSLMSTTEELLDGKVAAPV
jgi:hypothetical protein